MYLRESTQKQLKNVSYEWGHSREKIKGVRRIFFVLFRLFAFMF